MKKRIMKIYPDNTIYFDGGLADIYPAGIDPKEEYDISDLTEEELRDLQKNKDYKKYKKKLKLIYKNIRN